MAVNSNADVKRWLELKGFAAGEGNDWDRVTDASFIAFLESRKGKIGFNWKNAAFTRKMVAFKQLLALEAGLDVGAIDGFEGPQTRQALEELGHVERTGQLPTSWRSDGVGETIVVNEKWPHQRDVPKVFGLVGTKQKLLELPYPMKIAWNLRQTVHRFSIHEKCHDSAERVLKRVLAEYGIDGVRRLGLDLFGGCLNVRKMRGGNAMSMHSWGIAIDFDPERNQLRWGRERAEFAKPEYARWWKAWEDEGWTSLGRVKNYDWMHVQAARI